jgi:acetaldehyde dehydrogenase
MIMRDTVFCLTGLADERAISQSIEAMVGEVNRYVPGYRLKQAVQFESIATNSLLRIPELPELSTATNPFEGLKVSVFLSVEGAAHYLPAYAGNLDIMTSAALQMAEKMAAWLHKRAAA